MRDSNWRFVASPKSWPLSCRQVIALVAPLSGSCRAPGGRRRYPHRSVCLQYGAGRRDATMYTTRYLARVKWGVCRNQRKVPRAATAAGAPTSASSARPSSCSASRAVTAPAWTSSARRPRCPSARPTNTSPTSTMGLDPRPIAAIGPMPLRAQSQLAQQCRLVRTDSPDRHRTFPRACGHLSGGSSPASAEGCRGSHHVPPRGVQ
jgi:hypothetical protein